MTQTRRGRPRKFEEAEVLERALALFWRQGYSGTSLDDLSAATGLNRPSLYAAFGNKKDIFTAALRRFQGKVTEASLQRLAQAEGRKARVLAILETALDIYTGDDSNQSLGCFVISTVPAEALQDADMMLELSRMQRQMDKGLCNVLAEGAEPDQATRDLAAMLATVLFGLSARARAGTPRTELTRLAHLAVDQVVADAP